MDIEFECPSVLLLIPIPPPYIFQPLPTHWPIQTLQRKSDLCIPRNKAARPRSQFHIHVFVSDLYSHAILLHQNRQTYPGKYSKIADRCTNWIGNETAQFQILRIFVSNFRNSVLAVHPSIVKEFFSTLLTLLQCFHFEYCTKSWFSKNIKN